jgi:hypothetical protein
MTFEADKRRKLDRMLGLWILNALGMVAWRRSAYGEAEQKIRLLHPLSWVWTVAMFLGGFVLYGVPGTVRDLSYSFKNDTVWW